jgi:heterotetrameric sarcosine oxidase gamma subunit
MTDPIEAHGGHDFVVQPRALERVFDFQIFAAPLARALADALPTRPGQAIRNNAGEPRAMHVAPGLWLVPDPEPDLLALLQSAVAEAGGMLTDVSGKWRGLDVTGPGATSVLRAAVAVESVLADRDCGALILLDYPCILIRQAGGFSVWVVSTYADAFEELLAGNSGRNSGS